MNRIMVAVSNILDVEFDGYDDQPYLKTKDLRTKLECQDTLDYYSEQLEEAYEEGGLRSYILDNMGEEFRIDREGRYCSCEITLATGGPGVWIDTEKKWLRLAWWGSEEVLGVRYAIIDEIDEIMEEMYMMSRRNYGQE